VFIQIRTDGARTSLIITEAFPKDAGSYAVTANNEIGKDTTSCIVSVKGRWLHETSESELVCSDIELIVPKFQLPLQNLEIQEGQSARLDCVIVGQPEPEVNYLFLNHSSYNSPFYHFFFNFVTF